MAVATTLVTPLLLKLTLAAPAAGEPALGGAALRRRRSRRKAHKPAPRDSSDPIPEGGFLFSGKSLFRRLIVPFLVLALLMAFTGVASAQSADPMTEELATAINVMWMLMAGFLVFFMQAGFALVETGFTRAKNVAHTMMMNMMVFCIGAIGYCLVGFGLQFGGVNFTFPAVNGSAEWAFSPTTLGDWGDTLSVWLLRIDQNGILGGSGFMLTGSARTAASWRSSSSRWSSWTRPRPSRPARWPNG